MFLGRNNASLPDKGTSPSQFTDPQTRLCSFGRCRSSPVDVGSIPALKPLHCANCIYIYWAQYGMTNAEEPARCRRAARILRQGAEALGLSPVLPFPRAFASPSSAVEVRPNAWKVLSSCSPDLLLSVMWLSKYVKDDLQTTPVPSSTLCPSHIGKG